MIITPTIAILWHYGKEFLDVDACLDAGKIYDYVIDDCRSDLKRLPYVPYAERYRGLLAWGAGMIGVGFVGLLLTKPKDK